MAFSSFQSELPAAAGQQWCLVTLGSQPQSLRRCWESLFLWEVFLQHHPTSKPKNSAPIPPQKSCSHRSPAPKQGWGSQESPPCCHMSFLGTAISPWVQSSSSQGRPELSLAPGETSQSLPRGDHRGWSGKASSKDLGLFSVHTFWVFILGWRGRIKQGVVGCSLRISSLKRH